jgi:L-asparaginase II
MSIDERAEPIALARRSGVVESVHLGHVIALDPAGAVVCRRGDPDVTVLPRSSLKPVQAVAMLASGPAPPPIRCRAP